MQRPNHAAIRAWAGAGEAGVESLLDELVGARKLPAPVEDLGAVRAMFAHHRRVADAYGLHLVSYEGGQHLAANAEPALREDPAVTAFFTAAQRHPKMAQVYEALLDAWHEAGGELFVHYSDVGVCSKYGCWGALETVPTDSVKYRALVDWSQAHPARWPNRAR